MEIIFVFLLLSIALVDRSDGGVIVGGEDAKPSEFPYIVSFQYYGNHLCGGSIITSQHVITAAHCCVHKNGIKSTFSVKAGELILSIRENHEQVFQIKEIYIHDNYTKDEQSYTNDICVLTLSTKLNLANPYVGIIQMATSGDTVTGDAVVSGWGDLVGNGIGSNILQKVTVPIIENSVCKYLYRGRYRVTDEVICAGSEGKDSCQSDSGGPLVANVGGRKKLVGVVGAGKGCGTADFPGIYARVSSYSKWVDEIISKPA